MIIFESILDNIGTDDNAFSSSREAAATGGTAGTLNPDDWQFYIKFAVMATNIFMDDAFDYCRESADGVLDNARIVGGYSRVKFCFPDNHLPIAGSV